MSVSSTCEVLKVVVYGWLTVGWNLREIKYNIGNSQETAVFHYILYFFRFLDQYLYRSHNSYSSRQLTHECIMIYKKYIVLFSSSSILIIGNFITEDNCSKHLINIVAHFHVKKKMIEVMLPNVKCIPKYFFHQQTEVAVA